MYNDSLLDEFYKLDSACISDSLDSLKISGGLVGIKPIVAGIKTVGYAYTVKYEPLENNEIFQNAGNYIDNVKSNSIIVIDNKGRMDCTVWGNILTQFAVKNKINGTVINGCARDIENIRSNKYPLFSAGSFMQSAKNRSKKVAEQITLMINGVVINSGDIIFCDDNGCVVIPINLANEILEKAKNVMANEEKIINAIVNEMSLEKAREMFSYSKPWDKK